MAVLVALTVGGCASSWVERKALQAGNSANNNGAKGVVVHSRGRDLTYEVFSVLPGGDKARCIGHQVSMEETRRFTVVGCGLEGAEFLSPLAQSMEKAADSLRGYFPHMDISKVRVVLVPERFSYVSQRRNTSPRDRLGFELAFRYSGVIRNRLNEREIVRGFAHEFTHLAERAQVDLPVEISEYHATIAETCVELDVFGDTVGYASDNDFMVPAGDYARRLPRFALVSMNRSAQATFDLQALFKQISVGTGPIAAGNGDEALRQFCRGVFSGLSSIEPKA